MALQQLKIRTRFPLHFFFEKSLTLFNTKRFHCHGNALLIIVSSNEIRYRNYKNVNAECNNYGDIVLLWVILVIIVKVMATYRIQIVQE